MILLKCVTVRKLDIVLQAIHNINIVILHFYSCILYVYISGHGGGWGKGGHGGNGGKGNSSYSILSQP